MTSPTTTTAGGEGEQHEENDDEEEKLHEYLRELSSSMKQHQQQRRSSQRKKKKKTSPTTATIPRTESRRQVDELIEIINKMSSGGPEVISYFSSLPSDQRENILRSMLLEDGGGVKKPLLIRILDTPEEQSATRLELIKRYFSPGSSPEKNMQWIENTLKIPFFKYSQRITQSNLLESKKILDEAVFGHEEAKHKIISYLGQLVRNQDSGGLILGLKSYPGVGKTNLVDAGISKILKRPFFSTSLGGVHDSAFLRGFQYTYEGSEPGYIARCLIQGGVMNPILFFDELDKVSQTAQGDDIINTLVQITDPMQSKTFQDRYFGPAVILDLSRCVFVFAYNDQKPLNTILKDRITEIQLRGFSDTEKFIIAKNYMIPKILKEINFSSPSVKIDDDVIREIIVKYTDEAGVRHLKRVLNEMFMELNLMNLLNLSPITTRVDDSLIKTYRPVIFETVSVVAKGGRVNGLFVDGIGRSGISPFEAVWIPSSKKTPFEMRCTGNLGKIMGESMQVAWSVAWNLLDKEKQQEWLTRWHGDGGGGAFGGLAGGGSDKSSMSETAAQEVLSYHPVSGGGCLHIHCRDSSTPKDGPSAGVALTLLMWSMLTDTQIPHDHAFTGEISLHGDVMPIGGLSEKLVGARRAGCKCVIFPDANLQEIAKEFTATTDFALLPMKHIKDILEYLFS